MIGYIQGTVLTSNLDKTLVLTGAGLGYELYTTQLWSKGESIELFVSSVHKDTGTELYGFADHRQKATFEFVLQVNGVGPKSAFSIVKNLGSQNFVNAILEEDEATLKSIPGIGSKTAKQIILDLKTKLQKDPSLGGIFEGLNIISDVIQAGTPNSIPTNIAQEIRSALKELGLRDQEIQKKFYQYQYRSGMKADDVLKDMLRG